MLGKIVLWMSAIALTGYGLACLISPGLPATLAGLSITSGDALAEMGAMYGGLQTGFGLFCLLGALRSQLYRPALGLLVMCIGGLALSRLAWTLIGSDPVSAYTYGAIAFESTVAILAAVALKQADNP